ncbi:hypothetical protein E1264_36620 [Actinomadura sp. KC216]|uniref:hypothetical protein n=1 Tax=Actinomadura sp. KC216 TaxID=2530370 RepID=UPI001046B69D|nr:hypothetical protein [Actinomadura sp. KC216]TDB78680.1 hypothetical protein E1264_36620 [Actinomadura sp. KC216]
MTDSARPSAFEKFVTRGINPVGFALTLFAYLFLPCTAMSSWEFPSRVEEISPLEGLLEISSTGANIAVHQSDYRWPIVIRLLAIVTLLVMAAGAGTALARPARRRSLYAAVVAAVSGVLLVVTGLSAAARMESAAREFLTVLFSTIPKTESEPLIDQSSDAAGLGAGFWLALVGLALIAAINLAVLLRARSAARLGPAEA